MDPFLYNSYRKHKDLTYRFSIHKFGMWFFWGYTNVLETSISGNGPYFVFWKFGTFRETRNSDYNPPQIFKWKYLVILKLCQKIFFWCFSQCPLSVHFFTNVSLKKCFIFAFRIIWAWSKTPNKIKLNIFSICSTTHSYWINWWQ